MGLGHGEVTRRRFIFAFVEDINDFAPIIYWADAIFSKNPKLIFTIRPEKGENGFFRFLNTVRFLSFAVTLLPWL